MTLSKDTVSLYEVEEPRAPAKKLHWKQRAALVRAEAVAKKPTKVFEGPPRSSPAMIDAAIARAKKPKLRLVEAPPEPTEDSAFDAELAKFAHLVHDTPPAPKLEYTSENDTYASVLRRAGVLPPPKKVILPVALVPEPVVVVPMPPPGYKKATRHRGEIVSCFFRPEEKVELKAFAERARMPMTDILRIAVLHVAEGRFDALQAMFGAFSKAASSGE